MPRRPPLYPLPRNRRLDSHLYCTAGQPCFFTVRASRDQSPFADPTLARIAVDCILAQREKSRCQLDVYCLLPDHLHAVVTPMANGTSSLLYVDRFKGWCGRLLRQSGWQGAAWQPRSYDHLLRREENRQEIAAYILSNPVRLGLCTDPSDYPWSGIPDPLPPDAAADAPDS